MNIVDYICLAVLAISALFGAYSGLITTTLNTASFFISWLIASAVYPSVTRMILSNESVMQTVSIYAEGAAHISSHEVARTAIDTLSAQQTQTMIEGMNIAKPFDTMLGSNIAAKAFVEDGLTTVAQYYDNTLFAATLNIVGFLVTLTLVFFIFTMVIATVQYVVKFPQLKVIDGLIGALIGVFRGVYVLYALYLLAPIVISILPGELSSTILQQSLFTTLFYPDNPMFGAIHGVL